MKATYKFILAAFAAAVALSSCTKDIAADRQDTGSQDGLRKIAISFDTPTKTYLNSDNVRPIFNDGDTIKVSNGKDWEDQEVVVDDDDNAFFKTSLAGQLTAVYPHKAAVVNPKTNEMSHTKVLIEKEQTGLFEDANIAIGTLNGDGTMTFQNKTAVLKFYVGQEIGVQTIEITSKGEETLATPDGIYGKTITVNVAALQNILKEKKLKERICYVAVAPHSGINFDVVSTTNTQEKPVKREFTKALLKENTLTNVFIPYFIDVNGQKWGYCNVGAFLPEEPGLYFAWGSTEGHKLDGLYLENNYKFKWGDCPFIVNFEYETAITFNKYVTDQQYWGCEGSPDKKQTLDPDDDAARKAWGEPWRMPTEAEFKTLTETQAVTGTVNEYISFGPNGLILPLTGNGIDEGMTNIGIDGSYWSSELETGYNDNAYYLYFSVGENGLKDMPGVRYTRRYYGYAIRPIYGQAQPAGNQTLPISVNPYTNGGTL